MLQRLRYPLLLTALLALLVAAWAGLLRIGWLLPATGGLAAAHGPLMVSGFLGTLIGLERAVALAALGRRWVYIAPILSALGVVTSLLGLPIGPTLLTAGSLALIAVFGEIIRRQPASFTYTMGFGTVLWAAGNVLWLAGWPIFQVVWWWGGYLVLTIAGERLEMARLTRFPRWAMGAFFALIGVYVVGLLVLTFSPRRRSRHPDRGPGAPADRALAAAVRHCAQDGAPHRPHPLHRPEPADRLRLAGRQRPARADLRPAGRGADL